jgi:hypothetical protein
MNIEKYYGKAFISNKKYDEIELYGSIKMESSKIKNLKIYGKADIKNSILGIARIYGSTKSNSNELKKITIYGRSIFYNTTGGKIKVYSRKIKLQKSNIDTIIIKNKKDNVKTPIVKLEGTHVKTIIFDGKDGIIYKDKKSKVESVENGKIVDLEKL